MIVNVVLPCGSCEVRSSETVPFKCKDPVTLTGTVWEATLFFLAKLKRNTKTPSELCNKSPSTLTAAEEEEEVVEIVIVSFALLLRSP